MSDKYTNIEQHASYGIGYNMGQQLVQNPFDGLDLDVVIAGIQDGFAGQQPAVSNDELKVAFDEINQRMQAAKQSQFAEAMEQGESYLEENAKRDEVTVTESGLQYEVISSGNGESPNADSTVRTHYHGTFIDGRVFDSSVERGQPAEFPVNGVIKGWTEALQMMSVGDKWKLHVPYHLAYGEQGAGGAIGPYTTLVFEVELLDVVA